MNTPHSKLASKKAGDKTDWAKLKAMPDSAIKFTKDAPRTLSEDWISDYRHHIAFAQHIALSHAQLAQPAFAPQVIFFKPPRA